MINLQSQCEAHRRFLDELIRELDEGYGVTEQVRQELEAHKVLYHEDYLTGKRIEEPIEVWEVSYGA